MSGNTDCGNAPSGRYECINKTGECKPNPKGWYKSCDDCNNECEKYWSCINGKCIQDGKGYYKSEDECINGGSNGQPAPCSISERKYDCDSTDMGCHPVNYNGPYSSMADCLKKSTCGSSSNIPGKKISLATWLMVASITIIVAILLLVIYIYFIKPSSRPMVSPSFKFRTNRMRHY